MPILTRPLNWAESEGAGIVDSLPTTVLILCPSWKPRLQCEIADVYAGRLQPRVAAGLAPLMNLLLRAIETSNFEERIVILEKRLVAADTAEEKHGERTAPLSLPSH